MKRTGSNAMKRVMSGIAVLLLLTGGWWAYEATSEKTILEETSCEGASSSLGQSNSSDLLCYTDGLHHLDSLWNSDNGLSLR